MIQPMQPRLSYPQWQRCLGGVGLAVGVTVGMTLAVMGADMPRVLAQTPGVVSEGYALLERGWVNDAIVTFREAVQQYPQSVPAQLGLAIAYQRAGQDANAWAAYQRVLTQDPNNKAALTAVGTLGGYRPEWQQQGILALTTLLNLEPQNLDARAQRALLYGYQGQYGESIADYEIVLAANPKPDAVLGAAQIYAYSGDYPEGLARFEQYLRTGATLPNAAITAYALTLQETGSADRAVQILSDRLQTIPEQTSSGLDATAIQIRAALAVAYQKNNQLDAALATLQPLRGNPDAALPLARALSAIGRAEGNTDLYGEAVALYRQVLQRTQTPSVALQTEVADVLSEYALSQPQALVLYQELIATQPENQSLQIKQLALANKVGQISRAELYQRLQSVLQVLPAASGEQRSIAQALIRVDPPAPELLPTYQALLAANVPFLYFRIAQIEMQQNNLNAARQALAEYAATPAGKQDLAPELLLAEIDRREGNLAGSADRYQTILAANPKPEVYRNALRGLAGIRLAQGNLDESLSLYEQLLAANPDDLISQLGRASIGYRTGKTSETEAEAVLDRWLRTEPVPEPPPELFNLVGALPADASRQPIYEALLAVQPNDFAVNRRLVQVLAAIDPDQARRRVEQLVQNNPDDLNVYFVQGELAQVLGDLSLASQAYETILAQQPENIGALSALGGVRFQERRYQDAIALYNQVLALKPDDLETRRVLAELSAAQDQPIAALNQLRQVYQLQTEAGVSDPRIQQRIQQLEIDLLRRRGFQPEWERY